MKRKSINSHSRDYIDIQLYLIQYLNVPRRGYGKLCEWRERSKK